MRWSLVLIAGVVASAGCRGKAPGAGADQAELAAMIDSLIPQVERAVGLQFTSKPRFAVRTKDEVKRYLVAKLDQEYPTAKIEGVQAAYRLLGMIPDSLDIKALLLPLYAEQVAGYYDPDSTTLYAVEGAKGDQLRLVLAHELVHAIQHQQLPLERLLKDVSNADRLAASQAILEGHATVAMLGVVLAGQAGGQTESLLSDPSFWQQYRESVKTAQTSMPVFRSAPLVLREGLIFPYLGGAEFMRWWAGQNRGALPSPEQLPKSTEQILHPDRYLSSDQPVPVEFVEPRDEGVLHEDTMGELELQIWGTELRGGGEVLDDLPLGWGGDRFRVSRTPSGPALVLYTVWDDSTAARRFEKLMGDRFVTRTRPGYRTTVEHLRLGDRPAVRIVRAPEGWDRWNRIPEARLAAAPSAAP